MFIGGTETTSRAIEFALAHMIDKPDILKKAQQELDLIVGESNIVEESNIKDLPYLHAIMKEVIRLHPSLPLLFPHSPSESCVIGGYTVPKDKPDILKKAQQELDLIVGESNIVEESNIKDLPYLHAIMKEVLRLHPSLPLLFPHSPSESCVIGGYTVPKERFLGHKSDYNESEFIYFPFGSGRRICPGTMMAERVFMYLLSSLVHSFDWRSGEGEKIKLSEKFQTVLRKKEPLMAIPTPRLCRSFMYE
ncbi:hypothetical protein L1987_09855 [Smallanthus sonchifolius]|uniref:Uncharacterized protein n=1 Tax=Smallanthus sonchifolius TaxID=185202 RepID=A0ACB9JQG8_9ASTR|nr:hypothetical protein L1987_09855 [Smallanthus sonchifolius]